MRERYTVFSIFSGRAFAFLLATHFLLATQLICGQAFSDDLIGVDWGGAAPTNWNVGTEGFNNQRLIDLIDESGTRTGINLEYFGLAFNDTSFVLGFDDPIASQIPTHSNPLDNIGGGIGDAEAITFTYSGLVANTDYEVYLFGGNTFVRTTQIVTGAVNFVQDLTSDDHGELWINGNIGSHADLSDFAVIGTSDDNGEMRIDLDPATRGIIVAGLAIRLASPPLPGDVNCDGMVDFLDIAPFIVAVTNGMNDPKADINLDSSVDFLDVNPFIGLLTGN